MEFHPLDRKWDNHMCQSLVETYGGDTARNIVQGRESGPEFWIGVLEQMQMQTDIDYP
jgi:hypothetical protein